MLGWWGGAAGRKRDEIWLYLGDKGSNSSSYAKKKKRKGCPVSLDPWSAHSLLLLAPMNGRCFMCMCSQHRCIPVFVLQQSKQELTQSFLFQPML